MNARLHLIAFNRYRAWYTWCAWIKSRWKFFNENQKNQISECWNCADLHEREQDTYISRLSLISGAQWRTIDSRSMQPFLPVNCIDLSIFFVCYEVAPNSYCRPPHAVTLHSWQSRFDLHWFVHFHFHFSWFCSRLWLHMVLANFRQFWSWKKKIRTNIKHLINF